MKKILIVDDQELVLISLEKCLSDLGYKIKSVNNIYEAIFIYDSFLPDLIISDVNMPDIINRYNSKNSVITQCTVGLELVKYIRQTQNHQIPIMVLSGNTDESIISQGFELGIDDYMKKPVSLTEIGARVKRLIGPAIPIEIGKT
jgi:CheY-like chemotaxis protein